MKRRDAKLPPANQADAQVLCGVPLLSMHGTADTDQSYSYDQNMANSLSNITAENGAHHK
jgi:hypothetical protein